MRFLLLGCLGVLYGCDFDKNTKSTVPAIQTASSTVITNEVTVSTADCEKPLAEAVRFSDYLYWYKSVADFEEENFAVFPAKLALASKQFTEYLLSQNGKLLSPKAAYHSYEADIAFQNLTENFLNISVISNKVPILYKATVPGNQKPQTFFIAQRGIWVAQDKNIRQVKVLPPDFLSRKKLTLCGPKKISELGITIEVDPMPNFYYLYFLPDEINAAGAEFEFTPKYERLELSVKSPNDESTFTTEDVTNFDLFNSLVKVGQ